jgi:hypothetical protein
VCFVCVLRVCVLRGGGGGVRYVKSFLEIIKTICRNVLGID